MRRADSIQPDLRSAEIGIQANAGLEMGQRIGEHVIHHSLNRQSR